MSRLHQVNKAKHAEKNINLNKVVNQRGLSTEWFYFCKLKDMGIASIRNKDIQKRATELGISRQTLIVHLKQFIELGWCYDRKGIFVSKSWKIVADMLGIECIKQRSIRGNTKEEMRLSAAMVFLKLSHSRQVYNHLHKEHDKKGAKHLVKKQGRSIALKPFISNSCRGIVKALGLKGAIVGSKILRKLEKLKLITIERINEELCSAETYWQKIIEFQEKENFNIEPYCFEVNGIVYRRKMSNIIIL